MADKTDRRGFLRLVTSAGGALIGALVAIPGVAYVMDPLFRRGQRGDRWFRVASLTDLSEQEPTSVAVVGEQVDAWTKEPKRRLGTVWLRKQSGQEGVEALTAECPHLGCKVAYRRERKRFACPCHDSEFTLQGEVLGGPAPRDMDPLDTRVVDGFVEVRFVRFRAQVPEREEIG